MVKWHAIEKMFGALCNVEGYRVFESTFGMIELTAPKQTMGGSKVILARSAAGGLEFAFSTNETKATATSQPAFLPSGLVWESATIPTDMRERGKFITRYGKWNPSAVVGILSDIAKGGSVDAPLFTSPVIKENKAKASKPSNRKVAAKVAKTA